MLAALALLFAADADAVTLRHAFTAGQTATYVVEQRSHIDMRAEGLEQQVAHTSETTRRAEVVRVKADGSGVVELTNVRARLSAVSPEGTEASYDSASGDEPPAQFEGVASAVGKPLLRMTVSPTGEVTKVEDLQRVRTDVEAANRSNLQPYVPLPEEPVLVGDQWKDVYQVTVRSEDGFPIPVKMQRTFTLRAVENGVASVDWRSVVRTPLDDPKLSAQLVSRELRGELAFDIAAGRVTSRTANGDREVVGFAGPGTSMKTVTRRTERLVETVAAGEGPAAK